MGFNVAASIIAKICPEPQIGEIASVHRGASCRNVFGYADRDADIPRKYQLEGAFFAFPGLGSGTAVLLDEQDYLLVVSASRFFQFTRASRHHEDGSKSGGESPELKCFVFVHRFHLPPEGCIQTPPANRVRVNYLTSTSVLPASTKSSTVTVRVIGVRTGLPVPGSTPPVPVVVKLKV